MEQELKVELQSIRNNGYAVPDDVDAYPYAQWMLDSLGTSDAELRDELIYPIMARWITGGEFRAKELRGLLLQIMSPDYLFDGISESGTDTVCKRVCSVRMIPLILSVHEKEPFLSPEQVMSVAEHVLEYVYEERDARGYVEGEGWMPTTVHQKEALRSLANVLPRDEGGRDILEAVLHTLHSYK